MGQPPLHTDVSFWRDPDLPGVEARYSSYNADAFRDHTHPTYSIGFLETGRTSFLLEGTPHTATGGQMVFIEPDTAHACNPDLDSGMTYRMFYVDGAWLDSVASELFGPDVGPVTFPNPVVDDPELVAHWRQLFEAVEQGADRLEKEEMLVQGLADCISRYARPGEATAPEGSDAAVQRAKTHLADDPARKVSLDELSEVAHLSRYHLLRVFQAATGLSPHAYQNQLRVDLAKRLLANGAPISQVAAEAGFVDQSHFSRVFKQFTGATPKQYQASAR